MNEYTSGPPLCPLHDMKRPTSECKCEEKPACVIEAERNLQHYMLNGTTDFEIMDTSKSINDMRLEEAFAEEERSGFIARALSYYADRTPDQKSCGNEEKAYLAALNRLVDVLVAYPPNEEIAWAIRQGPRADEVGQVVPRVWDATD